MDKETFCTVYCPMPFRGKFRNGDDEVDAAGSWLTLCDCEETTECPFRDVDFNKVHQYQEPVTEPLSRTERHIQEYEESLKTEPCPENSLVQCNNYDIDCKRCIHCKPHKETADCKDYIRCETTGLEVRCETVNGTGRRK